MRRCRCVFIITDKTKLVGEEVKGVGVIIKDKLRMLNSRKQGTNQRNPKKKQLQKAEKRKKKRIWPPNMVCLVKCSVLVGLLAAPAMGFRYGSFAIFGFYLQPLSAQQNNIQGTRSGPRPCLLFTTSVQLALDHYTFHIQKVWTHQIDGQKHAYLYFRTRACMRTNIIHSYSHSSMKPLFCVQYAFIQKYRGNDKQTDVHA